MIVNDVVKRVQRQFGDESAVQLEDTDVIRWINDAQKDIAVQNDLMQATGTLPTIVGTTTYAFPSDMISMRSMYYNNLRLKYMSQAEYDEYISVNDPDEISSDDPMFYTKWGNNFRVYPKPAAVGTLKLLYTQRPPEVDDINDGLSLPLEYHPRIVEFCLKQAYEMDEDWDAAAAKTTQYDAGLSILKENEQTPVKEYYPTITVLPDDQW
jgi:hypothetical protein